MSNDARALQIVEAAFVVEDPAARKALVALQCGADAVLRARVEQLLSHDNTDFRLTPTESFARPLSVVDAIPDRIGPYRVTGEIARGGMGAVVRAERDDGVFNAVVAIKLIRADLASDRARRRFEDERRILARLRHAGVVRILDGGEVEGRPWLAMDYIDGRPITEALQGADMSVRLDAFEAVCDAVAYAHRNLVIHADIKPSNVLMSADSNVHLLDFGIARLIVDLDEAESGDPYPLTKGYAAPERGVGVAPTIASDVFSLGVLLLGMLNCKVPGEGVDYVAGTRLPLGQLDGDLGAIAAKALSELPDARYADVPALVSDIRRHRSFVPVSARRNSGWLYFASRFVQRHRRGLALTAIAVFALVLTTAVSTASYLRAEQARVEADRRFTELRGLARFMLGELTDRLSDAPGTVAARARLAEVAGTYLDRLRGVPDAPADLRLDTARGFRRLAALQGLSGTSSLGQPELAKKSLDAASALLAPLHAEQPDNAAVLEELGWVEASRWTLLADTPESSALNTRAAALFVRALKIDPSRQSAVLGLATTDKSRAYDLIWAADRPAEAIPVLNAALARLRSVQFGPALDRDAALLEVNILGRLGDAIYYAGDIPGALMPYRAAKLIVAERLSRAPSVLWTDKLGEVAFNIAGTLADLQDGNAEALRELNSAEDALARVLAFGPDAAIEKRLLIIYGQKSLVLAALGHRAEAVVVSERSIGLRAARRAQAPADPQRLRDLAVALPNHARLLKQAGRSADACAAAARAAKLWFELESQGDLSRRDAAKDFPDAKKISAEICSAINSEKAPRQATGVPSASGA